MPPRRSIEKAKDLKGTLIQLAKFLKPFYFTFALVIFLSVCSTLIGVVGPLVSSRATTIISVGVVSKLNGGPGIDFDGVWNVISTMIILYLISAAIQYLSSFILTKVSVSISFNLRKALSEKIDRLPLKYFDGKTHGEVLSRVTNDVGNISDQLTSTVTQIVTNVLTIIGVLAMMLVISVKLTLVALIVVPVSGILAASLMGISQKYFKQNQKFLGEINGHIEEMYSGHLEVKTYNYEEKSLEKFDEINTRLFDAGRKSIFISMVMHPLTGFIGNIGYVAVCLIGGFEAISGRMTIGNIQAFIQYVRRFNQPINSIAQLMNTVQSIAAAAERVFEVLNEEEEVKDTENPINIYDENGEIISEGNVTFENVKFGYDPENIVINDFSMHVKAGQNVAIVGPTGAGKTTLVKLLMRFYELNGGTIYVDGNDIKEYARHDLRNLFGMVLQDAWLFEGTIRENIRFSKPDATDEEIYKACKDAHVDHFIRTMDKGYDTVISEESSGISQGQKQLLTIARAFLKDPKILILDEATSSVDTRTEKLIQDSMESLRKGRTAFTIAHRLSTIKNADIIIVLDKGDVVEVGDHNSLMEKNGFYARLYNSQFDQ